MAMSTPSTTPYTSTRSSADSIARQPAKPAGSSSLSAGLQTPKIQNVDRIDCTETFADTVSSVTFDGQTLRIEFGVTRMDEVKKGLTPTGKRYPVCRLVLPPAAAVDLINKMQQTAAAMEQAGLVKSNRKDGTPPAP
jgi:hypothetical protein